MGRMLMGMLLCGFCFVDVAWACCMPVANPGLWDTVSTAERIVVVEVDEVERSNYLGLPILYALAKEKTVEATGFLSEDFAWVVQNTLPEVRVRPTYEAKLTVVETLKGHHKPRLSIPLGDYCDDGGYFVEGETTIAFLRREGTEWKLLGVAESTLHSPSTTRRDELIQVIRGAVDLQAADYVTEAQRQEWALEAVSRPGSRAYVDEELDSIPSSQLAKIFAESPTIDYSALVLLQKLGGYADAAVDRTAVRLMEAWMHHPKTAMYYCNRALPLLRERLGQTAEPLVLEYGTLSTEDVRNLWKTLRPTPLLNDEAPSGVTVASLKSAIDALDRFETRHLDGYNKVYR